MTKEEKKNYVLLSRRRYGELTDKKDKGAFLDQFCATTGMSRKNARRGPSRRRTPPYSIRCLNLTALRSIVFANLGWEMLTSHHSEVKGKEERCWGARKSGFLCARKSGRF